MIVKSCRNRFLEVYITKPKETMIHKSIPDGLVKQTLFKISLTYKILILTVIMLIVISAGFAQTRFKSLNYLYSISGSYTLSGQHNDQKDGTNENYWTNQVFNITGKYPALWGGDILFHGNSAMRWSMAYEAERQWNRGAVINIMWHVCPPTGGTVCGWDPGVLNTTLSAANWTSLLTNGGSLNNTWKQRIDSEVIPYLQYLEDKGVEVLWRPLHEQNQTAFWYNRSGAGNTKALWRLTYDYMTNVKGLTNLIWVWDVQDLSTNFADYNPGSSYFDMVALDVYSDGYTNLNYYNNLLAQAGGKPIAIGENFVLPNSTALNNQPRMSFFMTWAYGLKKDWNNVPTNSDDYIRQVYNNPRVITLDEMPGWNNPTTNNLATNKPVVASSTEAGANVASKAVDGTFNSRWSSTYADNQWIRVDLGACYNINRVKLTWEAAYANNYRVELSADGSTGWTTIKTVTGKGSAAADDWTGLSGTGRYLRVWGVTRATAFGMSLFEIEAWGSAASCGGTGSGNLALNKTVTSSNENTTNTGAKAVDGNGSTRWSSPYANNQNFIVDLGASYSINRVKIVWENAYAKDYQIQVSNSLSGPWPNLKEVYGKSTAATDDWTGLSGTGRYIKFYGITRATQYGFSFWEFEVYGTSGARQISETVIAEGDEDLMTAYPNPTTGQTTIAVNLPHEGHTAIRIEGNLGNTLAELHNGYLSAGKHEFNFNADQLSRGLFFYSVVFNGRRVTKKLLKQ
jgi:hypothetical protein